MLNALMLLALFLVVSAVVCYCAAVIPNQKIVTTCSATGRIFTFDVNGSHVDVVAESATQALIALRDSGVSPTACQNAFLVNVVSL